MRDLSAHDREVSGHLPEPIADKLAQLTRRLRRLILLKGCAAVVAVLGVALVAVMAVDVSVTLLDLRVRAGLSALGLAATLYAAHRFLARPLAQKLTLARVARLVEANHPELQERISTAVELVTSTDPDELRGSRQLIARTVDSAVADVLVVKPEREFTARRARGFLAVGGSVAVAIGLALAVWPGETSRLLARALAPHVDIGNAFAGSLLVFPGDARVGSGDPITIEVRVEGGAANGDKAEILRTGEGGKEVSERMTFRGEDADGAALFSITFPSVAASFDYRLLCGRALTAPFRIEVMPRPEVASLEVGYAFPPYTGLPPRSDPGAGGDVAALPGTWVTLTARAEGRVSAAAFTLGDDEAVDDVRVVPGAGSATALATFFMEPAMPGSWSLQVTGTNGLASRPLTRRVDLLEDAPPSVSLVLPSGPEISARPDETITLDYRARDDFGVATAELLLAAGDAPARAFSLPRPQPAAEGGEGHWAGRVALELRNLDLSGIGSIQFRVRVADNLPPSLGGPQWASSDALTVNIDAGAPPLAEQNLAAEAGALQRWLEEMIERLRTARETAADHPAEVAVDEPIPPDLSAELAGVRAALAEADTGLHRAAEELERGGGDEVFRGLAPALRAVARDEIEPARRAAEALPLADAGEERSASATGVNQHLDGAIAALEALLDEAERTRADAAENIELARLADAQEQLRQALQAAAAAAPGAPPPAGLREEQQRVADALAGMAEAGDPGETTSPPGADDAASPPDTADSTAGGDASPASPAQSTPPTGAADGSPPAAPPTDANDAPPGDLLAEGQRRAEAAANAADNTEAASEATAAAEALRSLVDGRAGQPGAPSAGQAMAEATDPPSKQGRPANGAANEPAMGQGGRPSQSQGMGQAGGQGQGQNGQGQNGQGQPTGQAQGQGSEPGQEQGQPGQGAMAGSPRSGAGPNAPSRPSPPRPGGEPVDSGTDTETDAGPVPADRTGAVPGDGIATGGGASTGQWTRSGGGGGRGNSGVAGSSAAEVKPEYRELVNRYFREVARRASQP